MTAEPFASTSPCSWGSDRRTRIMLFAIDLGLQPGESLSLVTADAEDATHLHYDLTVEYVGPVAQDWISAIVLRLNDNLGDVGDVLVRVSYRGSRSNRARVAIGHAGGGPPDDVGAIPTPIVGYAVSGQVRGANGEALDGVEVTLANTGDGSKRTTTTSNGGKFRFANVRPGFNYTVMPSITEFFLFSSQSIVMLDGNRELDFRGTRTYSIRGRLTDASGAGASGALMVLNGAQNTTVLADSEGYYWLGGLVPGNYTMTVDSPYHSFPITNINHLDGNELVNLSGNLRNYTLAGRVRLGPYPADNIEVTISGSSVRSTRTDSEGQFSFSGLPAKGNYTITPSVRYYDFFPAGETVTDLHSHVFTYYFVGTRQTFAISGKISDQEGNALSGVAMNLTGVEQRATVTDSAGRYEFAGLPAGYGYTVTPPSTSAYTFTPQNVAELNSNQTLDFTGLRRLQLKGRVLDQSGNGILGIKVSLT
ncbi:MAG TPA: carboxypeptidase-like regulatory domain-containing protein, partial [Pyrinomonadaceae bacterium]